MNMNVLTFCLFVINVILSIVLGFSEGFNAIPASLGWLCAAILQFQKCVRNGDF